MSWLLSKGYSSNSSLELVGNRYRLNKRQRHAVWRGCCSDQAMNGRKEKEIKLEKIGEKPLVIDGYNLLITVEAALGGGLILYCRDGTVRDIASIHGTYRRVEETMPALTLIGDSLNKLSTKEVQWFLDKPVSNSGRLKTLMGELAGKNKYSWNIDLVNNPDKVIVEWEDHLAISSDGWVLDSVKHWTNLHKYILNTLPEINKLDLQHT
ncbi:MAG: DUF434 domain-containing protein [Bacteroidia bacterium]|nr:DUF434 domain-containing protein [Bacteroidia bacterium]